MAVRGQGVYLWFLARELARLGHEIDVLVGPPYPDPMPFARFVERLPNPQYWGGWFNRDRSKMLPRPIRRVFSPLNFYELAASRMGFLPEPFAFSVRALRALSARIRHGARYDLVHDVQCLGWGLLPLLRMGLPVVSTVHHPLSVDRRASFHRDRTLREALGTMEVYPGGNLTVFHHVPVGPERTVQKVEWYFPPHALTAEEQGVIDFVHGVRLEDIPICESVQRGLHSLGYRRGRFVVDAGRTEISEHAVHDFQAKVLRALAAAA